VSTGLLTKLLTPDLKSDLPDPKVDRLPLFSAQVDGGGERKFDQEAINNMFLQGSTYNYNRPTLSLSDLEGNPYIISQSDRSNVGLLESIDGVPINLPMQGGQDFMFSNPDNLVWASDKGVITNLDNTRQILKDATGRDPILLPYTMGTGGVDFSLMPISTQLLFARNRMSRTNKNKLDRKISKVIPNWKGVDNPESLGQLRDVSGLDRKFIMNMIDQEFKGNVGALSAGRARFAVTDPRQLDTETGTLRNVGLLEDFKPIPSTHDTYKYGLVGEGLGELSTDVNARDILNVREYDFTGGDPKLKQRDFYAIDRPKTPTLDNIETTATGLLDDKLLRKLEDKGIDVNKKPKIIKGLLPAVVTAGTLTQAEEADATFVGVMSKFGFKKKDFKDVAEKMEKEGKTPQEIWDATSWERNKADGKWVTELPNTNTKMRMDILDERGFIDRDEYFDIINGDSDRPIDDLILYSSDESESYGELLLSDLIDDDELLDQYDKAVGNAKHNKIGDIIVKIDPRFQPATGGYDGDVIYVGNNSTIAEMRSVILHELQHDIQEREGFGRGMAPDYIRMQMDFGNRYDPEKLKKLQEDYDFVKERYEKAKEKFEKIQEKAPFNDKEYKEQVLPLFQEHDFALELLNAKKESLENMKNAGKVKAYFDDIKKQIDPDEPDLVNAHEIYSVFSGEQQARNVQLSDQVRREQSGEIQQTRILSVDPETGEVSYSRKPIDIDKMPPSERDLFTDQGGIFEVLPQDKQPVTFGSLIDEIKDGTQDLIKAEKDMNEWFKGISTVDKKPMFTNKEIGVISKDLNQFSQLTKMYRSQPDVYLNPNASFRPTVEIGKSIGRMLETGVRMFMGGVDSAQDPDSGAFEKQMSKASKLKTHPEYGRIVDGVTTEMAEVVLPLVEKVAESPVVQPVIKSMKKGADAFIDYYDSLSEEEQKPLRQAGYGALGFLGLISVTPVGKGIAQGGTKVVQKTKKGAKK
jgi:hypothetical protein